MTEARDESARLRLVRQYYRQVPPSERQHSPNSDTNRGGSDPRVSLSSTQDTTPDTTLTAFLQLIAIRLSIQRAIVSLVDRNHQYFIAEATRTGDILDPSVYENEEDRQWMGNIGSIGRDALCTNTIVADDVPGSCPSFVVTDLQKDPRFCDLPYVAGSPYFRFYVGTPLISPEGYRVGTVFAIDDRPHPLPRRADLDFLGIMAANVMNHLETQKAGREQSRQSRMSKALAAFVEGKSSIPSSWNTSNPTLGDSDSEGLASDVSLEALSDTTNRSEGQQEAPDAVFVRASSLLREALDVDHTVFLNTDSDTGLVPLVQRVNSFASATRTEAKFPHASPAVDMGFDFLKRLCHRYRSGKIWSFHEDGSFEYDDSEPLNLERDDESLPTPTETPGQDAKTRTETEVLLECFPRSRQILFVPLWDSETQDQTSACFAVSEQELPVFTTATEVAFVRAFTNSLTVVCGRISATLGEQQKAEFISSMSHELRSPLHGIVASAEMLRASALSPSQQELCRMVDLCSQTLLETISQILDFNKINNFLQKTDSAKFPLSQQHDGKRFDDFDFLSGLHAASSLHVYSDCDVASLCEQALDVVVASFASTGAVTSLTEMSVSNESLVKSRGRESVPIHFIASNVDWAFSCSPGAIRRIVMNLISNSLKYTEKGSIRLDLKLIDAEAVTDVVKNSRRSTATITVTDTGQGMSAGYLRTKLFRPFSKGDTTAAGSGLGLSLVSGIVKSLDGHIGVQSTEGQGTTVKIRLPLQRPHQHSVVQHDLDLRMWCRQNTFSVYGSSTTTNFSAWETLRYYLLDWFGFQEVTSAVDPNFVFLAASDLEHFLASEMAHQRHIHAIILLSDPLAVYTVPQSPSKVASLETLTSPVGPEKLSRVFQACRNSTRNSKSPLSAKVDHESTNKRERETTEQVDSNTRGASKNIETRDSVDDDNGVQHHDVSAHRTTHTITHRPLPTAEQEKSTVESTRPSVLCVDDNPINLNLLRAYNKRIGCVDIALAEDGLQAFNAVKQRESGFDIIFMDLTMPVCDGFESTRMIRQFEDERQQNASIDVACHKATIVAFTGLASEADQKKAFAAGVDHFVTKPLRFPDFKKLVSTCRSGESGP